MGARDRSDALCGRGERQGRHGMRSEHSNIGPHEGGRLLQFCICRKHRDGGDPSFQYPHVCRYGGGKKKRGGGGKKKKKKHIPDQTTKKTKKATITQKEKRRKREDRETAGRSRL